MYAIPHSKLLAIPRGWLFLGLTLVAWPLAAQNITNSSNGTLAGIVAFGSLTPARATTLTAAQIQFRLRDNNAAGYHVDASATFTPTTTGAVAGGTTIAASDIGVGIASIGLASNVITPRTDSILYGFAYDPTTVAAPAGVTPYLGVASGQATLADLLLSKKILRGPRIATVSVIIAWKPVVGVKYCGKVAAPNVSVRKLSGVMMFPFLLVTF